MVRRVLSLALVLQMLLVQLLQCHCHASDFGEDRRPHVHLSSFPFPLQCGRIDHHEHEAAVEPPEKFTLQGGEHEHDCDAFYLSELGLSTRSAPTPFLEFCTGSYLSSVAVLDLTDLLHDAIGRSLPPTTGYPPGPPFFLKNLALLI